MSKIRLGTTNIDFKTNIDVNRIFTSVVAAITPAGGLMVRLSIGTSLGALAGDDINNFVMNGNIGYFKSSSTIYSPASGFITRVDLTGSSPTAITNGYSANGVYYTNNYFKKSLTVVASNSSVVNTTGSGTINSSTLTVASSTGILLNSIVTGVSGIRANTKVLGINGNVLTLSDTLSATIASSAVTFTDLPTGLHSVFVYNDTNSGGGPAYNYVVHDFTTLAITSMNLPTCPYLIFNYKRTPDGGFWFFGDDMGNSGIYASAQVSRLGYKGVVGNGHIGDIQEPYGTPYVHDGTTDSSNNGYVLFHQGLTRRTSFAKLSPTSRTEIWSYDFTIGGSLVYFAKGTVVTFNDNHYICGKLTSDGSHVLIKVDVNGSVIWSKRLSGMAKLDGDVSIHVETVATVTSVYLASNADGGISLARYTDAGSSATLIWQNKFTPTSGSIVPTTSKNSSVYVTGNGTSFIYILSTYAFATGSFVNEPFILKLPSDGTNTNGTFTLGGKSFTYASGTYTNTDITSTTAAVTSSSTTYVSNTGQYFTTSTGTLAAPTNTATNTPF